MPKKQYNWSKVTAGDIISFRYKGKEPVSTLHTLLVLNPKMPYTRKGGIKTFHLIGLKLEDRGTISTIKNKPMLVQLLDRIGDVQVVSKDDKIYRVEVASTGPRGATKRIYNSIKSKLKRFAIYRTYDYKEAKKSGVFLEPIKLPKPLVEVLIEN